MNAYTVVFLVLAAALAECGHTFMGSSVQRHLVLYKKERYSSNSLTKRIGELHITIPASHGYRRIIQGILAYDMTHTGASANVTAGGLGYNFVTLRMKSDRAKELHFDVYIYA